MKGFKEKCQSNKKKIEEESKEKVLIIDDFKYVKLNKSYI